MEEPPLEEKPSCEEEACCSLSLKEQSFGTGEVVSGAVLQRGRWVKGWCEVLRNGISFMVHSF